MDTRITPPQERPNSQAKDRFSVSQRSHRDDQFDLHGLAIPNTKIAVSLRLHDCRAVTGGINVHRPDSLRHYFFMGKRLGYSLSPHLMSQAPFDDEANEHIRELARSLLRSVLRLPNHPAREMTTQGIVALLLWLVLHDRTQGQELRETMLQSLRFSSMALVTIESSPNRTYSVSIGQTSLTLNAEARVFGKHVKL